MAFMQSDIQRNIQSSLPVMPNNGNPNGAYNMPVEQSASAESPKVVDPMAWLQPSEYMTNIKQLLQAQQQRILIQQNESKEQYNYVPRDGRLSVQEVDDSGVPVNRYGGTVGDEMPVVPSTNFIPQYTPADGPVLPRQGITP